MSLYHLSRSLLCGALVLSALPGCARTPAVPQLPQRYHDQPPVVDTAVRYQLPVDTRIALSGNYGELRPNHFHGGLDFKTDQTTGHPVYCFSDGFVRRAAINAYGYGLVLYVEHPALGLTSVYGHLESFGDRIMQKVRQRQVDERLNNADVTFEPGELPVHRGDVIALSGNTGSSGGPHVHFELRNIPEDDNDIFYDPQMFFLRELADTKPPRISHVYVYPQPGQGLANGQRTRQVSQVNGRCATTGGEGGSLAQPLTAWGRIGLGLKAYDYMDGQSNKYGVKDVRLLLEVPSSDGSAPRYQLVYHFRQDAFRYSETRYTNSVTDYASWVNSKSMIMKSYIEPGNFLQQVDASVGNGIVDICEERLYHFIYELEDAHGNFTSLDFDVRGVAQPLAQSKASAVEGRWVEALHPLQIDSAGCHFYAGPGVFYTDVDFRFKVSDSATVTRTVQRRRKNSKGKMVTVNVEEQVNVRCESRVYELGHHDLPMHMWCSLSIDVHAEAGDARQLYLTNLDGRGAVRHSAFEPATAMQPACVTGEIREGGRYAVRRDTRGPEVAVTRGGWQRMQVSVSDEDSGLARFQVLIDGKFVPFDMDNSGRYFGSPCHYGVAQDRDHQVEVTAWDNCGNVTRLSRTLHF